MAQILLSQGAAAPTPPSGVTTIYSKVDGSVYSKDPSGVETPLGVGGGGGGGSVTNVSVASSNGFAGSVASPTTTPVITLTTTITGLLKGTGTALAAAGVADLPVMTNMVGGIVPTPPNDPNQFLNGLGAWATPPGGGGGSGTVTSFTFTNANGFTGSVSTSTTTPTLSLGTSVTGILKGNGTAISTATGADLPVMTATVGGAVPTPPNNTTTFLRGDGTFAVPAGGGSGTVTSVSVVTANGVSGTVATSTTTPAITLTLGNITPSKVNGNTITTGTGTLTLGAGKTLTANNSITLAGTDSTTMTFPPASANVGYLGMPQNSQSAAYTCVLADSGKHLYHPSADTFGRIYTIPANSSVAYPIGTVLTFVNDTSAGTITIAITTDTIVLAGAGTTGSRTLAANGVATAIKITATRWIISGTGLT